MTVSIRHATEADTAQILAIVAPILAAGETYAIARDLDEAGVLAYWFDPAHEVFVAERTAPSLGPTTLWQPTRRRGPCGQLRLYDGPSITGERRCANHVPAFAGACRGARLSRHAVQSRCLHQQPRRRSLAIAGFHIAGSCPQPSIIRAWLCRQLCDVQDALGRRGNRRPPGKRPQAANFSVKRGSGTGWGLAFFARRCRVCARLFAPDGPSRLPKTRQKDQGPKSHEGHARAHHLLKSLGHVHRVVERRNTYPILANVLMSATGDGWICGPRTLISK